MKIAGLLSLLAGWFLILAAVILLPAGIAQSVFVVAALGVEGTGLVLAVRAHMRPAERDTERDAR